MRSWCLGWVDGGQAEPARPATVILSGSPLPGHSGGMFSARGWPELGWGAAALSRHRVLAKAGSGASPWLVSSIYY